VLQVGTLAEGNSMQVTGLDHIVLRVADMERAVGWWSEVLGLPAVRLEEWRRGEVPFVSVRVDEHTIVDLQLGDITGTNMDHVALVVRDVDLAELAASGRFGDVRPPRTLFGARGTGLGIYVKDPDGHTVELRTYPD
jgi:catechol 2,3-dioxygenase-like lactoylglutathione lyase family enzyme